MKAQGLLCCFALMLTLTAQAGVVCGATGGSIPDGAAEDWSATANVSGYLPSISDVTVSLNLLGGYDGDLYAYLSNGGVLVPLLNRAGTTGTGSGDGFGYGDTGLDLTLSSSPVPPARRSSPTHSPRTGC